MLRLQRVQGIESRAGGLAPMEVIEEIVLVQCMSQVLAHTDEIQHSSKCRLLRVYTCPSLTGVRAAALAGLAITPLPASALIAGLRILGVEEGLSGLPDLEFAIYEKARPDKAAAALGAASA
jgi:DNA-binding transcriptional LysR family regulator